ncbi:hypothetical protein HYY75_01565 [bacterium]|nr:hypothetical protein [bacterium]
MESHVQLLRNFRDQYLLGNTAGKFFTETYYRVSPPIAEYIANHDTLRLAVRAMLMPMVLIVSAVFSFGGKIVALMLILLALSMGMAAIHIRRRFA